MHKEMRNKTEELRNKRNKENKIKNNINLTKTC